MYQKKIFFRNDDVRNTLDESLVELTNLHKEFKIPITYAVEPANVSQEVVGWLINEKKHNPNLIEIIQHGYNHNFDNKYSYRMEFGKHRGYQDQYKDLKLGKDLMNEYFGDLWFQAITFPYGSFNNDTIKAISDLGYLASSTSISFSRKHQVKNNIGRFLKLNNICGKKVSYHLKKRPQSNMLDVGVSVNFIKKYISEEEAIHYNLHELQLKILENLKQTNVIGFLLHHRFHKNNLEILEDLLKWLKQVDVRFCTLKELVNEK